MVGGGFGGVEKVKRRGETVSGRETRSCEGVGEFEFVMNVGIDGRSDCGVWLPDPEFVFLFMSCHSTATG